MIEVNAVFTKEKIKEMSRGKRIGNYILFPLLAAAMLAGGIATLLTANESGDTVAGVLLIIMCPLIVGLTIFMTQKEYKDNCTAFGVNTGEVVMNFKFSETGVLVSRLANGKLEKETLYYRELYKVKRTKQCFMLYVNKDEMFYVPADSFVQGTGQELFDLLYKNKVILDY